MSITYKQGDLFTSLAETLVIPVNCRGVAGRGVALTCKQKYPQWFAEYQQRCQQGRVTIGSGFYYDNLQGADLFAVPTKDDWRDPSQLIYVVKALQAVKRACQVCQLESIAVPKLGCGAGGLSWRDVCPLMVSVLSQLPCEVMIYV